MKERPILFSAPMVRAILSGQKTQTRRIVKGSPVEMIRLIGADDKPTGEFGFCSTHARVMDKRVKCPYGMQGDRLWVRETWSHTGTGVWRVGDAYLARDGKIIYRADADIPGAGWFPSIHMPKLFSRINIEIADVRVHRLQDITLGDIVQEVGVGSIYGFKPAHDGFRVWKELWDGINGASSWDANPWVYAITFKRVIP